MEGTTDNEKELLIPAIKGTTGILESIQKKGPSVKRVVITSSFSSIWNGSKGTWPEHTYTEADWNPVTYEEAKSPAMDGASAYSASKAFAERAAWDFMEEHKLSFSLATVCPPMLYGPTVSDIPLNLRFKITLYRHMSPQMSSS
jgi:nucleoside-diphosphate-sugar epimerase